MIPRTYGQMKDELARVSGIAGITVTDPRLLRYVNLALEILFSRADFPGRTQLYRFEQFENRVALPYGLLAIERAAVDEVPINLVNRWYEFIRGGVGLQLTNKSTDRLIDRGESAVARQPNGTELYLRLYSYADERVNGARPRVRITGYDADGVWIRTQTSSGWIDGFELELAGDQANNYTTSPVKVSHIVSITKPVTRARVGIFYWHSTLDQLYIAGEIPHSVENSAFRIYELPSVCSGQIVTMQALCRRRLTPIIADSDLMPISSIPVLRYALMAIAAQEAKDLTNATQFLTLAIEQLTTESAYYYPEPDTTPAINVVNPNLMSGDNDEHVI